MRLFITGATGLIGRRFIDRIKSKKDVLLLAINHREAKGLEQQGFHCAVGNLNRLQGVKKEIIRFRPQTCVHLAWQGIPNYSGELCRTNLNHSLSLLDFLVRETACKKIIATGSCAEYGRVQGACREDDRISIASYLGWAKNAIYNYGKFLCDQKGIDFLWFRLFYVYGLGQHRASLIPSVVQAIRCGRRPEIKTPLNANDFIFADDVAAGLWRAVQRKIEPGIYNLGSGVSTKVLDIVSHIEEKMTGQKTFLKQIKIKRPECGSVNFWADITKAKRVLKWEPGVSIKQGIVQYINAEEGK